MRKFFLSLWTLASASFEADKWATIGMSLLIIISSASSVATPIGLKLLVDAVARGRDGEVVFSVALIVASLVISQCVSLANLIMGARLREATGLILNRRLIKLTTQIASIEHYERAEYLNELEELKDDISSMATVQNNIITMLNMVLRILFTLILLGRVYPWLLFLPLFGLPSVWASFSSAQKLHQVHKGIMPLRRLEAYFCYLSMNAIAAKEIRIFGLRDEILQRHRTLRKEIDREEDGIQIRNALRVIVAWTIFSIGFLGAIVFVTVRAVSRQVTVGDVVLVMTLASQVDSQVSSLSTTVARLFEIIKAAERYLWLRDYGKQANMFLLNSRTETIPESIRDGIALEHLSFCYPGTDRTILADVNLHLPAGATVAIVGENGAGKTTLVKLLSRLYEPTQGRITVDTIDIKDLDIEQWRERISAGFQDFIRFELLARDVVGIGDLPKSENIAAVEAALGRAQANAVVAELPGGLQTQLGRSFKGGVELSGGQWQKLALGRAMMRPLPLLLILDEPTSALDAQTEHALFQQYTRATHRIGQAIGAISILVSHRFSTVYMADLIVVLNKQGIEEVGSHEELIANHGLYSRLYELQSSAYR